MAQSVPIDPDKGIPDLVSQRASDSKRLLKNEVQLAKLETRESVGRASKGALWMVVAFAFVVVAVVDQPVLRTVDADASGDPLELLPSRVSRTEVMHMPSRQPTETPPTG